MECGLSSEPLGLLESVIFGGGVVAALNLLFPSFFLPNPTTSFVRQPLCLPVCRPRRSFCTTPAIQDQHDGCCMLVAISTAVGSGRHL